MGFRTVKPPLLLISRKWPPAVGGMETYSAELAASLEEHFIVDTLVLPGRDNGDAPGLMGYAWFVLKAMAHCLLHAGKYSRVIFCDLLLFPAAICHRLVARSGQRLVIVYGLDLVYQHRKGLLPFAYRQFFRLFIGSRKVFSSVVAISSHTAALAANAGLGQVAVINPSLPGNELTDAIPFSGTLPDSWRNARRRILYFGRLVPRKGALWFAESVLPEVEKDVEFFVVGHSNDSTYIEQLRLAQRTHLLGRVESGMLASLIRQADIVVMPNIPTPEAIDVEGFGLAAIETTSIGGRLLASRIDGIVDAVIEGVTGTLLPPADAETWTEAVRGSLARLPQESSTHRDVVAASTRRHFARTNQSSGFLALFEPDGIAQKHG